MHLIVDHVTELDHVDHPYGSLLVEALSGTSVIEVSMSESRYPCLIGIFGNLLEGSSVEDRGSKLLAEFLSCPSEYGFVYLTDIHTRRYPKRVEYDIHRSSVLKERHILITYDTGYDTLVTVATSHLVPYFKFTLLSDVYLGELHDTRR